jgi:hypothetical protein
MEQDLMELTKKVKALSYEEKINAVEFKLKLVLNAGNRCFNCGELLGGNKIAQLAHIVPKHKSNIEKYGAEAIHHELNLKVSCNDCNSLAMRDCKNSDHARNIFFKPIYDQLREDGYNC